MDRNTIVQTGIATSATVQRTPPRSWIIRVTAGLDQGREVSLGARPLLVGADEPCDLILTDPTVSRRHAEIRLTAEGICVRDLDSTNGTFYKSSRIHEVVLGAESSILVGKTRLTITAQAAPTVTPSSRSRFGGLVGQSVAMREVFAVLELASPTDATILIEGESGTGKELAARAIHDHSTRAGKPLIVVDCSATQEHLVDSQLFGHVRGAYTGAVSSRKGAFVEAREGTVFLDEIGELPLASQAKLLRAIEARTVQPLGSDQMVPVDARVIAATNRDLNRMVAEHAFRFDLYQRLAVVHLRLPSLRDRSEDLPILIQRFYEDHAFDGGEIGGDALQRMERYDWPGNVRELRNVLDRAWILSGGMGMPFTRLEPWIQLTEKENCSGQINPALPFKEAKERWLGEFERRYLALVYHSHGGNISQAAAHAGINRNHFRSLLLKYGLIEP